MKYSYCIILAAGLSSRMGAFKPLLPINQKPSIVFLINRLHLAGVDRCIVVTGHNHDSLIAACASLSDITFVHNPDYATTGMFESAKIGFQNIPNDCNRVLLTLADIPLISVDTITQILLAKKPLIFPSYHFHRGHPVGMHPSLLPTLLKYTGSDGLRGAFSSLDVKPAFINTDDAFILRDMDTPADYEHLIQSITGGHYESRS